ncbi:MAG: COG4223 family protein [Paracoccaceae bacterium]
MADHDANAKAMTSTGSASAQAPAKEKGTFLPLVFGGAVATALGFFGGQLDSVETALGWGDTSNDLEQVIATQAETLEAQASEIAALSEKLNNLPEPVEVPEVDLSGVEGQISDQAALLAAMTARLTDVEKRPLTDNVSDAAVQAYEAELAKLQAAVETQRAQAEEKLANMVAVYEADLAELQGDVEAQRAEVAALLGDVQDTEAAAEAKARAALARTAMSKIITSVQSGASFADALAELDSVGGTDVPDSLRTVADEGVPTLSALQSAFPAAARAALTAARTQEAESGEGGLGGFLQRQLGARSVTPQEGDSADAVLSRAEAAAREGRLGDALSEVNALPEAAKAPLMTWINQAEIRHAATVAADDLMTALSAN